MKMLLRSKNFIIATMSFVFNLVMFDDSASPSGYFFLNSIADAKKPKP